MGEQKAFEYAYEDGLTDKKNTQFGCTLRCPNAANLRNVDRVSTRERYMRRKNGPEA